MAPVPPARDRLADRCHGRDKMLLGTLTLVSGLLTRGLYGIYDRRHVYTPFYTILYGGFAPGAPVFAPDEQTVVCDERDFQTVITLIDCLVNHTARIYAIIGKTDSDPFGSAPGMPADLARLCEALPRGRDFHISEAIRTGEQQGLGERTTRRMVGRLVSKYQVVERVKYATYRRVERKEGQA